MRVNYIAPCLAAMLMLQATADAGSRKENLAVKAVFSGRYPQSLVFRADYRRSSNASYDAWARFHRTGQGTIKKYLDEELDIKPIIAEYASKFAETNPEKLMLMHFNGEARNAVRRRYVSRKYFPGHWITLPGTTIAQDIGPNDLTLKVRDTGVFSMKQYVNRKKKLRLPPDLIMVRVDETGRKLWRRSEYAKLVAINRRTETITVKRGQYFSNAIAHRDGRTYIAPLDAVYWGGWMWFYNLSSACPKDGAGKTASDVLVDELKGLFAPGGTLCNLDGIAFDVNYFQAKERWDVDNDGLADGGIVSGRNIWRDGDWRFLKNVRKTMGPDFIITCDAHHTRSQQAVGVLNGMESEGLVQHNDAWRGFSRTVNTHTYWDKHNSTARKFRYIALKFMHPDDARKQFDLMRLGMGAAACLGAATTIPLGTEVIPPELVMGSSNKPMWLGRPVGKMIRIARAAPDLLQGRGVRMTRSFAQSLKTGHCRIASNKDGVLTLTGSAAEPHKNCTVTLPPVEPPAGDVTVYFDVESTDPLIGMDRADRTGRVVRMIVDNPPDYGSVRESRHFTELWGLAGTHGPTTLSFYYRQAGARKLTFTIRLQEQAGFKLSNMTIRNSPAALAREFENGVVLVNPAQKPIEFNLRELFSFKGAYRRIASQNPNRMTANPRTRMTYAQELLGIAKYNDGRPVKNARKVTVPALNALFLIKVAPDRS